MNTDCQEKLTRKHLEEVHAYLVSAKTYDEFSQVFKHSEWPSVENQNDFTKDRYELLQKVAKECAKDTFVDALCNNSLPAVKLTDQELSLLTGGGLGKWLAKVVASGIVIAVAQISGRGMHGSTGEICGRIIK